MHVSAAVGTLMAGVANLCTSIFTAQRIPRIFPRPPARLRAEIFPPLPLSDLTAGSRRGSAMTCYHSDRQAER